MYESMAKDLAPLSLSFLALAIFIVLATSVDPAVTPEDVEVPEADAGPDLTVVAGSTATLDGTRSSDDAGISSYQWSMDYAGSPLAFTGETALFTFEHPGVHVVTLTVTDEAGNTDTDTFYVTVTP